MKRLLFSFGILSFIFILSACNQNRTDDVVEEVRPFSVTYVDEDGSLITSFEVMPGGDAPVPEGPFKEGYTFEGWSEVASNVNKDLEITAMYQRLTYTVTYLDFDGRVIASYPVYYGEDAPLPDEPSRQGYTFERWSESAKIVQSDLQITAEYLPIILSETNQADLLSSDVCKIQSTPSLNPPTPGFPTSPFRLPNVGTIEVQVLYADFPDYEGSLSETEMREFLDDYMSEIVRFFDIQSFGNVSFNFSIKPDFVRIPKPTTELSLARSNQARDMDFVVKEAILIADKEVDFSNTDLVIVMLNPEIPLEVADVSSSRIPGSVEALQTNEKKITNALFISGAAEKFGYSSIIFDLGRLLGLTQLRNFDWQDNNPNFDWQRQFIFTGVHDFMSFENPNDSMLGDNRDMLGWQRYLLNWVMDEQIRCLSPIEPSETFHELIPMHQNIDGHKLIVLPFNNHQALAIEVREKNEFCQECRGGVYTYYIDNNLGTGQGPIRMIRPSHSQHPMLTDAYLSVGQSLIFNNIKIEVIENQSRQFIKLSVVQDASAFYEDTELNGIAVYLSESLDASLLMNQLPRTSQIVTNHNQLQNLFTSEEVYIFIEDEIPPFLMAYENELSQLRGAVIEIINDRGQRLIIGRATGAFVEEYYESFIRAVGEGINGSMSLPVEGPQDYIFPQERHASSDVCYMQDFRELVYPRFEPQSTTVSHQIPIQRVPSSGTAVVLNVLVGFTDIPVMVSDDMYRTIIEKGLERSDAFFDEMSNGKFSIEWRFFPELIYIPFFIDPSIGPGSPEFEIKIDEGIQQVLSIVDEGYDLTDVDIIQFFWPIGTPDEVYGGLEVLTHERLDTQRGNIYNYNVKKLEMRYFDDVNTFGRNIYHGILHNLGLTDIYIFSFSQEWSGFPNTYKYGNWDPMTSGDSDLNGWHRWILSWMDDDKVYCIPPTHEQDYEVFLGPLNQVDSDVRMIVISLSETEAISIELRDPNPFCEMETSGRFSLPFTGGCNQNVLVTHIDSSIGNGSGPMTILRTERSIAVDFSDALMLEGEFVTYENITITHSERHALGSVITIEFGE